MRKNRIAILAALAAIFLCGTARAQGVRYDNIVLGPRGVPAGAAKIEVFPASGSSVAQIASASETGYVVTVTTAAAHGFTAGQTVSIADSGVGGYNGLFTIVSVPTSTTFVYQANDTGLAASTGGIAGVTPATIYSDWGLTSPIANPATSDSLGNYGFWAAPAHYIIQISGSPYIAKTVDVFLSCDASSTAACGSNAGTGSGSGGPGTSCTIAGSFYVQTGGTPTVYLCTVVNGNLTWLQQSGTVTLTTTPPTSCTAGTWTFDTLTDQLWLGSSTNACTSMQGGTGIAGTENYLAKFALPNAVGNSSVKDDASQVSLTTEPFSIWAQPITKTYPNDGTTGTVQYELVTTTSSGDAITPSPGATNDVFGIAGIGAGTTGNVEVAQAGTYPCKFDNGPPTAKDFVTIAANGVDCHDAGTSIPSTEAIGSVTAVPSGAPSAPAGAYYVDVFSPYAGGTSTVCKGKTGCGASGGMVLEVNSAATQATASFDNSASVTWSTSNVGGVTHVTATSAGGAGSGYACINNQTVSYTTVLGDAGCLVAETVASANTVTIPTNASVAYGTGTIITVCQLGAGQTSFLAAGGVTINTPTSLSLRAQQSCASVAKIATDTWQAMGDLQ